MSEQGLVLALDTSTEVCVGLARDGVMLANERVSDRLQHVEQLMPLVRNTIESADLQLADLDLIAVGLGPGPFTGLRVGVATARVLGLALSVPIHGVCSLDVIAAAVPQIDGEFVVAIDARRKELYWARYDATGVRIEGPSVSRPEELPPLPTYGPGADLYLDVVQTADGPRQLDAGLLAAKGRNILSAGEEPLYLRRPDAAEPGRRKSVLVTRPERDRLRRR